MFDIQETKEKVKRLIPGIKKIPDFKLINDHELSIPEKRDEEFQVFIITYGRPNDLKTIKCMFDPRGNFSQDYYLICSDDDPTLNEYVENYGDRVIVFNKDYIQPLFDRGDNFDNKKVSIYSRNICFAIAEKLGYEYFLVLDDDYPAFTLRIIDNVGLSLKNSRIYDMDRLFKIHLDFLKTSKMRSIAMAQGGDFIGGLKNKWTHIGWKRKLMNSFFFKTSEPILFDGTFNEDVTYYVMSGRLGIPNISLFGYMLTQETTQQSAGGMSDAYLESGTYVKSFYSVMYCPSQVRIQTIGHEDKKRIHHFVRTEQAYAEILDEKYSKSTYSELNSDEW